MTTARAKGTAKVARHGGAVRDRDTGPAAFLSWTLPAPIQALRDRALALHRGPQAGIPELALADARAWAAHTPDEDWLLWRGRRAAERLRSLPVDVEPGERLVGRPRFRSPGPEDAAGLEAARRTLASVPPFPGGDPGHFHPDWVKLFRVGVKGIRAEIAASLGRPGLAPTTRAFYEACDLAMSGLSAYAQHTADACAAQAGADPAGADHWQHLETICRRVASEPPATFHEALQLQFIALVVLWYGEDHGLTCPGRLDQLLRPFYEADLAAGRITAREAFDLIACLYIQLNRLLWPGSAVAVMVGGRDNAGRDVTHELTYLCLAARLATRLVYPTVGLAWHTGTPAPLRDVCLRLVATGVGDPAFFNDELIVAGLRDHGVAEADSFRYMNSTCVEIKVCGASHMWVTAPYFNLPTGLLAVLDRVASGAVPEPGAFADLCTLVRDELAATVRQAAANLDRVWQERGRTACFPLASCLIADCLARGLDFDRGGARYNWVENSFVGLANLVDSLVAVKHLVFDRRELSLTELRDILGRNFVGHEPLRQRLLHALPHYGSDLAEPDAMAREWAEFLIATTEANTVGPHRYVPGFFCWVMHERLGAETGATPDGRLAGQPLADGAGGAQGRETHGPTAAVLSTTGWSHRPVLGGLVQNLKFPSGLLRTERDRRAVWKVVETFLRRGGFEIQVNVVDRATLLAAQQDPEPYRDLLVRVAGYSDYFVHLNRNMQDEVIARTEHVV